MDNGTLRAYVSDVRSAFKMLNMDNLISDRYIANELIKSNLKLIDQQLSKRQGWNSPNLFTTLPCIQMQEADIIECCDVAGECKISRSKEKLPIISDNKLSLVVQGVWSIDKRFRYKEITPDRYSNLLNLDLRNKKDKYFWIQDNYIYVSDSLIEKVSISAFFPNPVDPILYSCDKPTDYCPVNILDLPFKTLPKLREDIVNLTYQKITQTYKRSVADVASDNVDHNK